MKKNVLVVGAGGMGQSHIKALIALKCRVIAVCRSENSRKNLKKLFNIEVISGGLSKLQSLQKIPKIALVATDIQNLVTVSKQLILLGVEKILIEKPGAISIKELKDLDKLSKKRKTKIFIGYNRRFYQSIIQLQKLISKDGGITSISFDFTEWSDQIKKLNYPKSIKNKWFLANSTHVVDTFIHLAGLPKKITNTTSGSIDWHPNASYFAGFGITENDVPFSYSSDWISAGRWGLEVNTKKNKYILRPLEKLIVNSKNTIQYEEYKLKKNKIDLDFKPGIYEQSKALISLEGKGLCSLSEHIKNFKIYEIISGYKS